MTNTYLTLSVAISFSSISFSDTASFSHYITMTDITADQFRLLLRKLTVVSASLTTADLELAYQMGDAFQDHQRIKFDTMVEDNCDRPCLYAYFNDGWSAFVASSTTTSYADAPSVTRKGKYKHEFMLERALLKVMPTADTTEMAMLMAPIRTLAVGKKAWNFFTGICEFYPLLREVGHKHICISAYLFDGMLFSALSAHCRARHMCYYSAHGPQLGPLRYLLLNMDWVLASKCAAHGCSNALHWALAPIVEEDTLDNVHISIQSLRNSASAIFSHTATTLVRIMRFGDAVVASAAEVETFWRVMGVESDFIDLFVSVNPYFLAGQLYVDAGLANDPECLAKVSSCMTYCLTWQRFSETRWVKVGMSARYHLRSFCIGLTEIVLDCAADPDVSNYYLNGHFKCSASERKYLAVAAMSSFVSESVLIEITTDDRLLLKIPEVKRIMNEEIEFMHLLPAYVWVRCAAYVDGEFTGTELRTLCLAAAAVSIAYMDREILIPLQSGFFSLLHGNVRDNLEALAATDTPIIDPTLQQVKNLLDVGLPFEELEAAILLAKEMPCSTILVEQPHALGAALMRGHEAYSERTLRVRAMLNQFKALVSPSYDEKAACRIQASLQRLDRRRPGSIVGRQMFLGDMVTGAVDLSSSSIQKASVARDCMRTHCAEYLALAPAVKISYDRKADAMKRKRVCEIDCERLHLLASLQLLEDRAAESKKSGVLNHVASCKFTAADVDRLCAMVSSPAYLGLRIGDYEQAQPGPPGVPTEPQQRVLLQLEEGLADNITSCPWWCKHLARNRDLFELVAFAKSEEADVAYLFLFAKKSPLSVSFLELRRTRIVSFAVGAGGERFPLQPWHRRVYEYLPLVVVHEDTMPITDDNDSALFVFSNVAFVADKVIIDTAPVDFLRFIVHHPRGESRENKHSHKHRTIVPSDTRAWLLLQYPWLLESDFFNPKRNRSGNPSGPGVAPDIAGGKDKDEDEHELIVGAAEALEALRHDWVFEDEATMDFYTRILGGKWTAEHAGVIADAVAGYVRGGAPKAWCNRYAFPKQAAFYIVKYKSQAACTAMAREYCRRGQHFYAIYVEFNDPAFLYSEAQLNSYVESKAWIDFVASEIDNVEVHTRVALMRGSTPQNPV
jgi:hypothetical protein